jgi:tetratricopeptide (TPR) repeat protein
LAGIALIFSGKYRLKLPVYYKNFYRPTTWMLLLAVGMLLSVPTYCQNTKIDSLKKLIESRKGIEQYDPLIGLVRATAALDNAKALEYAKQARAIAIQFADTTKIVTASRIEGQLLNRLDRSIEAENILLEVLPIAKRNNIRAEYKNILNNLAVAYTVQAKYDKALDMNFQTLMLREQDKDIAEINVSLNNIGLVYFKLKNYQKALEYYERALKLLENAPNQYFLDRLLVNIGLCYNQLERYDEAEKFFDRAFKQIKL